MRATVLTAGLCLLVGAGGCYEVSREVQGADDGTLYVRESTDWGGLMDGALSSDRYAFDVSACKWRFLDQKTLDERIAAGRQPAEQAMASCRRALRWNARPSDYDPLRDGCWFYRHAQGDIVFVSRQTAEKMPPSTQPDTSTLRVWHHESLVRRNFPTWSFLFDGRQVCLVTDRAGKPDGVLLVRIDVDGDALSVTDTDKMGQKPGAEAWTYAFWRHGQALLDGCIYYVDVTVTTSAVVRRSLADPGGGQEVVVPKTQGPLRSLGGKVVVFNEASVVVVGSDGKIRRYPCPDRGVIGRTLLNVFVAPPRNVIDFLVYWPYLFMIDSQLGR